MPDFHGNETCILDGNGRTKLSSEMVREFRHRQPDGHLMLYCLPDGCIGVYAQADWDMIRRRPDAERLGKFGQDAVLRREMRRFGMYAREVTLSNQGRITLPTTFRDYAKLQLSAPIQIIGDEIGIEIWNPDRLQKEIMRINQYENDRSEYQLNADLATWRDASNEKPPQP